MIEAVQADKRVLGAVAFLAEHAQFPALSP